MSRKKKMTRAQAAAARWNPKVETEPETYIDTDNLGNSTIVIDKGNLLKLILPVGLLVVVAAVSFAMSGFSL